MMMAIEDGWFLISMMDGYGLWTLMEGGDLLDLPIVDGDGYW